MERLNDQEAFDNVVQTGELIIMFKHSATCPVSQAAYEEFEKFAQEHPDLKTYYLIVQEDRPLSNHIAESFHIKHESPQAILFNNSDCSWHASHWKITFESLTKAIEENS
ncbi:bacillithiol system protein YtxJ [Cytobacillus eiseniae]|uniref:Bacillithiol system protein YtxJ n=1 Tax=Cytobacillus eiseniae TaxID=762947 RepID=A0ABS4RGE9_9BACI|nr:bacillithiol system redox-active protein YtxJ [Cytobacillus eiseniae]MBP2241440.1 bacillithiol system protein YtxJ [Cytobacillus eiseniae]